MASPGKYDIQYRALAEDRIGRLTSNPGRTEYLAQGQRSQPATTPLVHLKSAWHPKPPTPGQPSPHQPAEQTSRANKEQTRTPIKFIQKQGDIGEQTRTPIKFIQKQGDIAKEEGDKDTH